MKILTINIRMIVRFIIKFYYTKNDQAMICDFAFLYYSFDHHYNESNETHTWVKVKRYGASVSPTDLRFDPTYIVVMHWLRTMFDGILPFVTLLFLNGKIFIGLKKVKHKIELHAKANSNTKDANGTRHHDQRSVRNGGLSLSYIELIHYHKQFSL